MSGTGSTDLSLAAASSAGDRGGCMTAARGGLRLLLGDEALRREDHAADAGCVLDGAAGNVLWPQSTARSLPQAEARGVQVVLEHFR